VRLGHTLFEHQKLYPQVLYAYLIVFPYKIRMMFAVLVISWGSRAASAFISGSG